MRDAGNVEVSGFGITSKDDPLCVYDICIVEQQSSVASVELDPISIADLYDDCIDAGLHPEQFGRVWIHTHPSGIHKPSATDEQTFKEAFGKCDWAVMYILAKDNISYCALQYNKAPAHRVELSNSHVDFSIPFFASDVDKWKEEYDKNVKVKVFTVTTSGKNIVNDYKGNHRGGKKSSAWVGKYVAPYVAKDDTDYSYDKERLAEYEEWWNDFGSYDEGIR
jgi:proteasome lid subunit RPN8/RPN11